MRNMKRLLRHPATHIIALGVLVFILRSLIFAGDEAPDSTIRITEGVVEELVAKWNMTFARQPTDRELTSIVGDYVREEVYYREAKKLGLDKDDLIVRRRLAQKMDFLSKDLASLAQPTDQDITDFYEKNREDYRVQPEATFSHIFFNIDKHGLLEARDLAVVVRDRINANPVPMEQAYEMGDLFVLRHHYKNRTPFDVEGLFGWQELADSLFRSEPGIWHGPVTSGYGLHLFYVHERMDSWIPELEETKAQVLQDLMTDIRRQTNDIFFATLRGNYEIEIDEALRSRIDLEAWQRPGQ
jgi:hypothetical protein